MTSETGAGGAGGAGREGGKAGTRDGWRTLAMAAFGPIVWGTSYAVIQVTLPARWPMWEATLRILPIGVVLIAVDWARHRRSPHGAWWGRMTALAVLNFTCTLPCFFLGAQRLPGGIASTLYAVQPLLTVPFALVLLGERPGRAMWPATAAGIIGVGLMVVRVGARLDAMGVAVTLTAATTQAWGFVLTKRWLRDHGRPLPMLTFSAWQLTIGGALLVPIAAVFEGAPPAITARSAVGLAYLSIVGTALAYAFWFRSLERISAQASVFLMRLSPIVAVLIGIGFRGESFGARQVVGMVLVGVSVVLGQIRRTARRTSVPAPVSGAPVRGGPPVVAGATMVRAR